MRRSASILAAMLLLACSAASGARPKGRSLRLPSGQALRQAQGRPFDAKRAFRDLVHQCDFGPRVPGTKAHERCAAWLADQLRNCADSVSRQVFVAKTADKSLHLTNIIATLNPGGQPRVLLCAHWDSRPVADHDPNPKNRGKPIAGANDGASGVAVLLEVARALKAHPPRDQVTIVLFDGEDYGTAADDVLLGSRYFAAHYQDSPFGFAQGRPPDWAVLLDMVGDKDLRLPIEANSERRAPQVVDRLWGAAARVGAKAFVRDVGPALLDDHIPLLERGIPCADVIDFDYPYWHTVADTPDKCSAESLAQVGRAVLAALQ